MPCLWAASAISQPRAATPPPFDLTFRAGVGAHEGQGLVSDGAGNLFATGQFAGPGIFGATTLTNGGSFDYFLAKYNAAGQTQWARRAGSMKEDFGSNLALDGAGNVLVVGTLDGTVDFEGEVLPGAGKKDAFLAKYRSDGSLVWVRTGGGLENDQGFGIGTDATGNVYVIGRVTGTATFGGLTVGSGSNTHFFLARYTPDGQPVWAKTVTTTGSAATGGLVVDGAGNSFVTGMDEANAAVFTAKYNADGNPVWTQRHAADGFFSEGTGIELDAAGSVYVGGRFGTATFTVGTTVLDNPTSIPTGFVAKYGPDGAPLWAQKAGSRAFDVGVTVDGVVYATGFFNQAAANVGGTTLPFVSGLDAFFARFETGGALTWATAAGSFNNDLGRRIIADGQGNVWAIGEAGAEAFDIWPSAGVFITRLKDGGPAVTTPALTAQFDAEGIVVSWPADAAGYSLAFATQLFGEFQSGGATVTPVAGQPNTFRVTAGPATLFIRLVKP